MPKDSNYFLLHKICVIRQNKDLKNIADRVNNIEPTHLLTN